MISRVFKFLSLLLISICAYADGSDEFSVKSAFMLKMTHFIDWPKESDVYDQSKSEFVICLEHEYDNGLKKWAETGKIKNKQVKIEYFEDFISQNSSCNIVYLSSKKFRKKVIEYSLTNQTLTISDIPGSAESGIIINFIKIDNKLRFEVNLKKANEIGFEFSPRLLRLANIVEGGGR